MKEKSPYETFFENTQDIQCITCLDAYVLEYYICDCRIRVERLYDGKFNIFIVAYDENGHYIRQNKFDERWKEKNIYNQAIVNKFVSGCFFINDHKPYS